MLLDTCVVGQCRDAMIPVNRRQLTQIEALRLGQAMVRLPCYASIGASVVKSTAVLAGLDSDRCIVMQTGKRMMSE
jgi:hypothetical protein